MTKLQALLKKHPTPWNFVPPGDMVDCYHRDIDCMEIAEAINEDDGLIHVDMRLEPCFKCKRLHPKALGAMDQIDGVFVKICRKCLGLEAINEIEE